MPPSLRQGDDRSESGQVRAVSARWGPVPDRLSASRSLLQRREAGHGCQRPGIASDTQEYLGAATQPVSAELRMTTLQAAECGPPLRRLRVL